MAELEELANEAAKELLKAIRDQAPKAGDSRLLNLAQAFSLVVSAELTAELGDDDDVWEEEDDWQDQLPDESTSLVAAATDQDH